MWWDEMTLCAFKAGPQEGLKLLLVLFGDGILSGKEVGPSLLDVVAHRERGPADSRCMFKALLDHPAPVKMPDACSPMNDPRRVGLLDSVNKNTVYPVKSEFQMKNKYFFLV